MTVPVKGLEDWPTENLLVVYERLFGALEQKARRRIVETARARGWDRLKNQGRDRRSLSVAA